LPDDSLLLCSDGLYNYITNEDLCALCSVAVKTRDISTLIDKANQNGGGDNITAVLFGMQGEEAANG
jgi:protein phosphatase